MSGSFSLRAIVDAQAGHFWGFIPRWNIFHGQFIGFFCYLMAALCGDQIASLLTCRKPKRKLVAGYHTEYSAMKFAMFFMAEYAKHDHGRVPGNVVVLRGMAPVRSSVLIYCR